MNCLGLDAKYLVSAVTVVVQLPVRYIALKGISAKASAIVGGDTALSNLDVGGNLTVKVQDRQKKTFTVMSKGYIYAISDTV